MRKLVFAIATMFSAAVPVAALAEGYGGNDATPPTYADDQYRYYNRYDNRAEAYDQYRDNRDNRDNGARARVVETRAVTEPGSGREECWNARAGHYEELRTDNSSSSDHKNLAGTVIGGIAGGVLGHQLGSGRGNTAATVGGAALGAYAGNRVENNRHDNDQAQADLDRSNCRTIGTSGNVQAYDVRYNWQGREYVARMDHDPGRYVQLGRDVNADGTPFALVQR